MADNAGAADTVAMLNPDAGVATAPDDLACVDQALAQYEDLVFGEIGPPGRPTVDASRRAALDAAILESEGSPLVSVE